MRLFLTQYTFSRICSFFNRRVYVGNLSWSVAWQSLKDHMRQAGEVVHAEVIMEYNGRSKGCGIVEYATDEEAQEAIKTLTDTELNGRMIFVREDRETPNQGASYQGESRGWIGSWRGRGRGGRGISSYGGGRGIGRLNVDAETQLFVGNLAQSTTWRELKDHFRQCGDIQRAEVKNGPAGQSKGFGTVQFLKKSDAKDAITQLNGSELQGNVIEVRLDQKAR
ncbi:predicted protein [Phaeodactylum tricornutum CCAP 1055/1]|uniref:RRM domain-containing protein n=2 Tax=Phaeodactylum tricornutum TaxID=2850 RepID=B7GER2_PHATC|nr:predicted protein [Phaeodactylum tricornutum CCAP 1055/1]EEC42891.1 predicted protein [Phaeodactylum tricornutum CCAP 1055/1]|eukprot:XP_002185593.1 predicted protein [Phaeodactylum tricornutum CCAP 1055/1]